MWCQLYLAYLGTTSELLELQGDAVALVSEIGKLLSDGALQLLTRRSPPAAAPETPQAS